MIAWIAAGELAALALVTVTFLRIVTRLIREQARERQLLINQLLHATGQTWQPPPSEPDRRPPEPERARYAAAPEQFPD